MPKLGVLAVALAPEARLCGVKRTLSPLPTSMPPGSQTLLADTAAMPRLVELTLDFLDDNALAALGGLDDRSLRLRRASLSGSKEQLQNPDEALVLFLNKAGETLEYLRFHVEVSPDMRQFMQLQHNRVGALQGVWTDRLPLRTLDLNWTAFDDEGFHSIAENCTQLRTLLLDQCAFWTDAIADSVVACLPELRHFRIRASSLLSDRCLYTLKEVAYRFSLIEIEPSESMSRCALEQLHQQMSPGFSSPLDFSSGRGSGLGIFDFSLGGSLDAVGLIAAAADAVDPLDDGEGESFRLLAEDRRGSGGEVRILKPLDDECGQMALRPHRDVYIGR